MKQCLIELDDNKNSKELERLLKTYVDELLELCRVCDITPERMKLASGCYECRRTGLRVECSGDVELEYHTCDWDSVSDDLHQGNLTPCGPLMDITLISGEPNAVHLPHFLCLGGGNVEDAVRVLRVEDSVVSFEKCVLTRSHAKLLDNKFSAKGLVMRIRNQKVHCKTLIYQTIKTHLTLHVYLIPDDKHMRKTVKEEECGSTIITKPGPVRSLRLNNWFTLNMLTKGMKSKRRSEITPEELPLMRKLNYFEIFIKSPKEEFSLQLEKRSSDFVWKVTIRKGERSVQEILLKCLEDLKSEDLKVFTWYLTEGDPECKIPKSKLENKTPCEIVSCGIDKYQEDGAGRVFLRILKKMNQNNLAAELQKKLQSMKALICNRMNKETELL
ncbi:hypothetical protein E1301_Tti022108 [Triplophysa tibetana]|uniref:NACHT, LRR and PYD domains-containing protein 1 n=1 Tax=Triplophysa tibetana TaxID=1572043 RepID=A0A5A9PK75_9TELE|nr:hypothetical protein E1301_Tti022108 [Triplophysa tibetana]